MSLEMQELEKWKQMPDWSEKLTAYSKNLTLVELNAHIEVVKTLISRTDNPPNLLFMLYSHFLDRALMNIAQNLQSQTHNF